MSLKTDREEFVRDNAVSLLNERDKKIARMSKELKRLHQRGESHRVEIKKLQLTVLAAHHLLMAATGPEGGPTSWDQTRTRWMKLSAGARKERGRKPRRKKKQPLSPERHYYS